jgi:hypothetical protein
MTGGTLALGCSFAALCILLGVMIGWPVGHWRGMRHAAEDAEDARDAAVIAGWKGIADATPDPAPLPVKPVALHGGPGKHRHPAGPRHAELPAAGYLPAETSPWAGTMTLPAPVQSPPWETLPPETVQLSGIRSREVIPEYEEPQTEVLEPTAADCVRPDALTDTGWTRQEARRLVQEMDRDIERIEQDAGAWIAERIGATDSTLKAITR